MKNILLDTNVYVRLVVDDQSILDECSRADTIFISVISLGELFEGFKGGTREEKNRQVLNTFLANPNVKVLLVTEETAEIYSDLKHALRKKGTPLPINDVWIAAHVIETGARLITYDSHFLKIPGLRVWDDLKK